MPRSVFTDAYGILLKALIAARKRAGVSQVELSERLGKPQPFISKIERGVRRIDVIEFVVIARALDLDPVNFLGSVVRKLPASIDI
ncbi:MAG: helix-turn-helix domain-containing protein [Alphaproteobacteria bacterium]|nr:helix-turn-helix domain-containing protein [Alphaproteobacteria bacterium]